MDELRIRTTVSRIERGELEPTWSLMNRLLASAGYQAKNSLVSRGDVSAVVAARVALGELPDFSLNERARSWIERMADQADAVASDWRVAQAACCF